jgi:hypothetical protein
MRMTNKSKVENKLLFLMFAKGIVLESKVIVITRQHILGYTTSLYNYILIKKDICNQWLVSC